MQQLRHRTESNGSCTLARQHQRGCRTLPRTTGHARTCCQRSAHLQDHRCSCQSLAAAPRLLLLVVGQRSRASAAEHVHGCCSCNQSLSLQRQVRARAFAAETQAPVSNEPLHVRSCEWKCRCCHASVPMHASIAACNQQRQQARPLYHATAAVAQQRMHRLPQHACRRSARIPVCAPTLLQGMPQQAPAARCAAAGPPLHIGSPHSLP